MNLSLLWRIFLFVNFLTAGSFSQTVYINEFMSSNSKLMPDSSEEYFDWLELYNGSGAPVNLAGYYLSDDTADTDKWQFPDITIDSFLVVFASDKNESELSVRHWETIINQGDNWKYTAAQSTTPSNWRTNGFNDSGWSEGPSGFGFGDDDDATELNANVIFLRKTFTVDNLEDVADVVFHIDYDDAFVAYLNGVEIARNNIGTVGTPPSYNATATNAIEAVMYTGGAPEKYKVQNWNSLLVEGENVIAVQVHNLNASSTDLTAIPFLTLGLKSIPLNPKGSPGILNLFPSALHTNFKLSAEGENLILYSPEGEIVDLVFTGEIPQDISRGRFPDGAENFFLFSEPTPGYSNSEEFFEGISDPPEFSAQGGFYAASFSLTLSSNDTTGTAQIFYTTDGSEPNSGSLVYSAPITISSTSVLRANVNDGTRIPSKTVTNTYFINENITIPVISLSTDPDNFWDWETGIYVLGPNAEPSNPNFGANFWEDWEKPAHIEFYEPTGEQGFSMDMGVKIFGAWSRAMAQKSLALFARSTYGDGNIDYQIFPDKSLDKFESIVLRNSGNDWPNTMMRDDFMTRLAGKAGVDVQATRPAILFINGEYWGLHNVREKLNEHFLADNHNEDADSITILEGESTVVEGDNTEYLELLNYLNTHNLSITVNYEYVKERVDVDEFTDYMLFQIYYDNEDWPGNNIKFWKANSPGSRWRWIMFDTDFGFGLYGGGNYTINTLDFATATNGPSWPNPPWSTLMLRKLLGNSEFKNNFINRFADLSNSILLPDSVTKLINDMSNVINPEMERHKSRWGQSYDGWLNDIEGLTLFAENRLPYMRDHFRSKFSITGVSPIALTSDPLKGYIQINSLLVKTFPWSGTYFRGVPVTVTAIPLPGYKFAGWNGVSETERTITINPGQVAGVSAIFTVDSSKTSSIVINEINYNSSDEFDSEDWIEFYNNSDSSVDISGWTLMDELDTHQYIFPDSTVIPSEGFVVLSRDSAMFNAVYPEYQDFLSPLDFGLGSGGDVLRLYNKAFSLIDSVGYDNSAPWPEAPDGTGHTLSLTDPNLDNSLPESWAASTATGTPGMKNDVTVDINEELNLPKEFSLEQNYPNPFNPSTMINYAVSIPGIVTLTIYDILGSEVKVLVNDFKETGRYSVSFDASELSSGVYFYNLKSGNNFNQTRKMLLIK